MSLQNLTIRSPKPDDKADFDKIHAGKHDVSASQAFTLVMDAYRSQGQNVSTQNTDGLQDEIEKLKTEIERLQGLQGQLNVVNEENQSLKDQITELQNTPPVEKTVEVEAKIKAPAFVFNPLNYDGLFKKMNRVIAFDIKDGKLKKSDQDLPAQFTAKALNYFMKNEYNHILK